MLKYLFNLKTPLLAFAGYFSATAEVTKAPGLTYPYPQEYTQGPNINSLIDLVEINNSNGFASKIISIDIDRFMSSLTEKITIHNFENVQRRTQKYLEENGYYVAVAKKVSERLSNPYTIESKEKATLPFTAWYANGYSPSANSWNANGQENIVETKNHPGAYCIVMDLTTSFNGESWVRASLDLENDPRTVNLAYEFGKEFSDMVRYHEYAHCMGANEERSDYVAAKLMLLNHPSSVKALAFLKLYKAIRSANTVLFEDMKKSYYGTAIAVDMAVEEYKNNNGIKESEEEIWTQAVHENKFFKEIVYNISLEARLQKGISLPYNFKSTAQFLEDFSLNAKVRKEKEIAKNMSEDLYYIDKILGLTLEINN